METERFGRYELVRKLALGGMAEVFLARMPDHVLERVLAIKRILPHLAEDPHFVKMFVEEAKIVVQLSHANIARIYELGEVEGQYYIAMEYIDGRDIGSILRRCHEQKVHVPVEIAVHILIKTCQALHHAHHAHRPGQGPLGLIHRDVSPSNLMVSFDGDVKVIDFGLAKAAGRGIQTQAGVVKGKIAYMSPEHAYGRAIDHRVDVYSAAVCLWELLTSRRLFLRRTEKETIKAVRDGVIPHPRDKRREVPAQLDAIVMRALEPDRDRRFPSAQALGEALEGFAMAYGQVTSREVSAFMRERFPEWDPREAAAVTSHAISLEEFQAARPSADQGVSVVGAEGSAAEGSYKDSRDTRRPPPRRRKPPPDTTPSLQVPSAILRELRAGTHTGGRSMHADSRRHSSDPTGPAIAVPRKRSVPPPLPPRRGDDVDAREPQHGQLEGYDPTASLNLVNEDDPTISMPMGMSQNSEDGDPTEQFAEAVFDDAPTEHEFSLVGLESRARHDTHDGLDDASDTFVISGSDDDDD